MTEPTEASPADLSGVMARAAAASAPKAPVTRPPAPRPVPPALAAPGSAPEAATSAPEAATSAPEAAPPAPEAAPPAAAEPAPAPPMREPPPRPKATAASVDDSSVLTGAGTLALHAAMKAALGRGQSPVFKVVALASGYTAELAPLAFQEIARLQASAVDPHAARMKMLQVLHGRCTKFSCGQLRFNDWMKVTAQGDFDTLMYGMYAATYPGDNDFDVGCRYCGHSNKLVADVNTLARVASPDVYGEITKMLDPRTDFQGAIANSLVGREVQVELPDSKIVAAIHNPSMQEHMEGVQYYQGIIDRTTGLPPPARAGADTIRTMVLYTGRLLVPAPGGKYFAVTTPDDKDSLIGRLSRADGTALADAIDEEVKKLSVSYQIPDFNCGGCGKRNTELALNFENLLFTKLQASA
jgi:hypothetical protein